MKASFLHLLILVIPITSAFSQRDEEGKFVTVTFNAPSLSGNAGDENPVRRLSVYLPPDYDTSTKRYPVIYFLHGYGVNDSLMVEWLQLKKVMDEAIAGKRIPPMLLVLPDSQSRYFGAFYSNSVVNGDWGDFIARDVVKYIDDNYRTIAKKESRGLSGHSMGGNGVMRVLMQYPHVFHAGYALSPGALHWHGEFNLDNPAFKILGDLTDENAILKLDEDPTINPIQFWIPLLASLGRSFAPDPDAEPHRGRLPVTYSEKQRIIHPDILDLWEAAFPINMAHRHIDELRSLAGLKIDWGRDDEFAHIPVTCRELSLRLEALGIRHEAEEYIGRHENRIGGTSGRFSTEVLPFFARLLEFQ